MPKKVFSYPHLTDAFIQFAYECSKRTNSSVLRVRGKWSCYSWNIGQESAFKRKTHCSHCPLLSTSVLLAGDSGMAAPGTGWCQMLALFEGRYLCCPCWQDQTGCRRTTAKNLTHINLLPYSSSVLKSTSLLYFCINTLYKVNNHCIITVSLYKLTLWRKAENCVGKWKYDVHFHCSVCKLTCQHLIMQSSWKQVWWKTNIQNFTSRSWF